MCKQLSIDYTLLLESVVKLESVLLILSLEPLAPLSVGLLFPLPVGLFPSPPVPEPFNILSVAVLPTAIPDPVITPLTKCSSSLPPLNNIIGTPRTPKVVQKIDI
uniref:Uncharacterized protein n=1 Tax=Porodaedalea pini TaxID=108901 RepID=A0A5B9RJK8_9AGAM|nr:hypothetical protein PPIT_000066 [Porodaedalea pini]QEG56947.1 hypothetical protein PPIT_000066 [Porodaedalea pini]